MIDIGSCFNYGIESIKKNPGFYIVATLILFVIMCIIEGIAFGISLVFVKILANMGLPAMLVMLVNQLVLMMLIMILISLMAPLFVGFFKGIKKDYEGGKAEVSDLFSAFDTMIPSVINVALAGFLIAVGSLLCYLPGIIVASLMPMVVFFIAKGEKDGLNPLKKSIALLIKNPLIILFYFIFNIIGSLGVLACVVGILVTIPFSLCATYKMFQQALGEDNPVKPAAQV